MKELLQRIAEYFMNDYTGDDKTSPRFELSPQDLREICNLYSTKCQLQDKLDKMSKRKSVYEIAEEITDLFIDEKYLIIAILQHEDKEELVEEIITKIG